MNQQTPEIKSSAVTDKGLNDKRPENEDSYLELPEGGVYAVADGVGGAFGGDVASQMAVETLSEAFVNLNEGGDVEERMRAAITQANAAIYQMSRKLPKLSTMATTLVALQINGNVATIGHVGDSRLYRLSPDGMLFQETQDHSVVEEEVRAGRMTRAQAAVHPSRNVISRALGAEANVEIDMKTIMFDPGSVFLICSDGITRHIGDEELRDLMAGIKDPVKLCAEFKKLCYERGAEDNLTAVVVSTADTAPKEDVFELDVEVETVATARKAAASGNEDSPGFMTVVGTDSIDSDADTLEIPDQTEAEVPSLVSEEEAVKARESAIVADEVLPPREAGENKTSAEPVLNPEMNRVDQVIDVPLAEPAEHVEEDELDEPEIEIPLATKDQIEAEVVNADSTIESNALETENEFKSYRVERNPGTGFLARFISALLWTLVGVLIGLIGFYLYSNLFGTRSPGVQNANLAIYEYEQKRREVDRDPAKYLSSYGTASVVTASDHYLVGRAYLLQKNYGAAKTSVRKCQKGARQRKARQPESS